MRKSSKALDSVSIAERPLCGCGQPATHHVSLFVRRLELDEAGGRTYWNPAFRGAAVALETPICDACVRSQISVTVRASASMDQAARIPGSEGDIL